MLVGQDEVTRGVDITSLLKFLNALPTTLNQGSQPSGFVINKGKFGFGNDAMSHRL